MVSHSIQNKFGILNSEILWKILRPLFEEKKLRYSSLEVKRGNGLTNNHFFVVLILQKKRSITPNYGITLPNMNVNTKRYRMMQHRMSRQSHYGVSQTEFLQFNLSII